MHANAARNRERVQPLEGTVDKDGLLLATCQFSVQHQQKHGNSNSRNRSSSHDDNTLVRELIITMTIIVNKTMVIVRLIVILLMI